jgi:hypothetical protein
MPFLLWPFSPGDKIENCPAQFLAVFQIVRAAAILSETLTERVIKRNGNDNANEEVKHESR